MRGGESSKAVRLYRLATGAGLSEAKRAVDAIAMQNRIVSEVTGAGAPFPFTTIVLVLAVVVVAIAIAMRGH